MVFYLSVQPYFYSYLLVVQRQSIRAAGYITQTFIFSSTITALLVSLLIKYTRRYKYFITAGSLIYLMGVGLMIRYRTEDASVGSIVGTQIAIGMGGGMMSIATQLGVQASAPTHQHVAAATAVFLTILEIGGAVGAAVAGAVWTQLVPAKLEAYLPPPTNTSTNTTSIAGAGDGYTAAFGVGVGVADVVDAHTIFGSVAIASDYELYPPGSPVRIAINRSYQETMRVLLTIALVLCAPLVILSFFMRNYKLDEVRQGVKGKVVGGDLGRDEEKQGKNKERNGSGNGNGENGVGNTNGNGNGVRRNALDRENRENGRNGVHSLRRARAVRRR